MADISRLARLLNGTVRGVDLTSNTLVVQSIKIGAGATELTQTILDKLILVYNEADADGTYDSRYFTESELSSATASSGSDLIGDDDTYSNFTPAAATVKGALSGIDAALASAGSDELVKVSANDTTPGYLNGKLVAGTGISFTENNDGGNETLTIDSTITQYTDELAQDAVGAALTDSATVDFTYNDGANTITADVIQSGIDHGSISGLGDDDHTQYILVDGTRAFTGDQSMGSNKLTNVANGTNAGDAVNFSQLDLKADDADVIKKDGSVAFTADQSMGGFKLTNVAAPTTGSDAANKTYVDSVAEGLKPKQAVRAATTVAGTLASDFENGDSIDGVTLVTGDRILIKDQAAPAENGIYIVAASGAPTRATDFDSLSPIDEINGAYVAVQEGTANQGKLFVQTGTVATINTDAINFTFFNSVSGLTGGDGITISGSNVSVDHDGEGLTFVANQLALELDGGTLSKSASGVKVADAGIDTAQLANDSVDKDKIAADVAGLGLVQNVDGSLEVNVDDSTIEIATDTVQLKDGGITNAKINASAAIEFSKMEALTADRVAITNGSGFISVSSATSANLVTLTDGSNADSLHSHSLLKISLVAGESMAANTSFLVRYAINGETAGRVYKADKDASSNDLFHVIGIAKIGSAASAGDTIEVYISGDYTLASSDAAFNATDIGKPIFLNSAGAFTLTAPTTTDEAVKQIGVVATTTKIFVQILSGFVN